MATIDECVTNAAVETRRGGWGSSHDYARQVATLAARMAAAHERAQARQRQDEDAATIIRLRRQLADAAGQLAAQERISAGLAEDVGRLQEVDCARPFVVGDLVRGAQRVVGGVVSGPDGCFAVDVDPPLEVAVGEPVAGTSGLTLTVDPEADTQRIPRVKSEPPPVLGED